MENADTIKHIVRLVDGKADLVVRVQCPFCGMGYTLLLIGRTGKYECLNCKKYGKLTSLAVYFEDKFEHKYRKTVKVMRERSAVERLGR